MTRESLDRFKKLIADLVLANEEFIRTAIDYGQRRALVSRVAIIGSSLITEDPSLKAAKDLSTLLAQQCVPTLVSGYNGISQAVIDGTSGEEDCMPLRLVYAKESRKPAGYHPIEIGGFYSGLDLLNMMSNCMVAFRPGIGTLARVIWVLQAAQLIKAGMQSNGGAMFDFSPKGQANFVPQIFLFESQEWEPLMKVLDNMEEAGTTSPGDADLLKCVSSVDELHKCVLLERERYETFVHENKLVSKDREGRPLSFFRDKMIAARQKEIAILRQIRDALPLEFRMAFFGSARIGEDDPEFFAARKFGRDAGDMGIPTCTGGGPSMMYAPLLGLRESTYADVLESYASSLDIASETSNSAITLELPTKTLGLRFPGFWAIVADSFAKFGGIGTLTEALIKWKDSQIHQRYSDGENMPVPPPIGRYGWNPKFGLISNIWEPLVDLVELMKGDEGKGRQSTIRARDDDFFVHLPDYDAALTFLDKRYRDWIAHMRAKGHEPVIHNPSYQDYV
jgi:predicted Rossmann-fold nucleotide-binding protein